MDKISDCHLDVELDEDPLFDYIVELCSDLVDLPGRFRDSMDKYFDMVNSASVSKVVEILMSECHDKDLRILKEAMDYNYLSYDEYDAFLRAIETALSVDTKNLIEDSSRLVCNSTYSYIKQLCRFILRDTDEFILLVDGDYSDSTNGTGGYEDSTESSDKVCQVLTCMYDRDQLLILYGAVSFCARQTKNENVYCFMRDIQESLEI